MGDGLRSDSDAGGLMNNGFSMDGGVYSSGVVEGSLFYPAILSGGMLGDSTVAQGLSVSPMLQGGMQQVGEVGSPVMRISADLGSGAVSNTLFVAQIIISPNSNYGADSSHSMGALYRIAARLSGGVEAVGYTDSIPIRASQKLQGSTASTGYLDGTRVIGSALNGGTETTHLHSGKLIAGARLQGSVSAAADVDGVLRVGARLHEGFSGTDATSGALRVRNNFQGGFSSSCDLDSTLKVTPALSEGVFSDSFAGGDITQGFRDPLLNTWALDIRSVTPILEIETPFKDI